MLDKFQIECFTGRVFVRFVFSFFNIKYVNYYYVSTSCHNTYWRMTYQYDEQIPYISIYFNICSFFRNNSVDITKLTYFPIFLIHVSSGILFDDIFLFLDIMVLFKVLTNRKLLTSTVKIKWTYGEGKREHLLFFHYSPIIIFIISLLFFCYFPINIILI